MAENSAESVVFIAGGAGFGAGVSATVGGMGLAGGFGAVGIGMAPVTVAGAVAGAAAYGAFKAIADGDSAAFGAIGIGAAAGAGMSATVGGMGLAGSFGAVSIGMGTMAAAGGVVGLGVYGLYKAFKQEPGQRMAGAIDAFGRMENKVLEMEAYTQALLELDPVYAEWAWKQKFAALEVEEELDTKALSSPFRYLNSPYSHSGFVSSLAFSRDRKILASASGDRTIRLWGGYTRDIKRTLNGHSDTVWSVAISPDGQTLASGSADKTIRLWPVSGSEQPRILSGHSGWVTSVAISPNGNILASGSTDGTIKLWNLHNGELIRTIDGQSTGIFSIAISPDGQTLASGSMKAVKLWNINTGELIQTLSGCSPVAFSPDEQTLVTGGESGCIKIWRQILGGDESTLDGLLSGEWWNVLGVGIDADPKAVIATATTVRTFHSSGIDNKLSHICPNRLGDCYKLVYRQLARQYHPDVNRSASAIAKMQAINKAYEQFLKEFSKAWFS